MVSWQHEEIYNRNNANTVTINAAGDYKMIAIPSPPLFRVHAMVTVTKNVAAPTITFFNGSINIT
jgi:hypothetical protein